MYSSLQLPFKWKQDPQTMVHLTRGTGGNDRVSFTTHGEQDEQEDANPKENAMSEEPAQQHKSDRAETDSGHALATQ